MRKDFKIIGFDADDTLWVNELYFKETEKIFCEELSSFQTVERISVRLNLTKWFELTAPLW